MRLYRHDQNSDELTVPGNVAGADVGMVPGLTIDPKKVKAKAWLNVAHVPNGFGVSPQALFRISVRRVTVAMRREVPSTSGVFQATIEHEHKHTKMAKVAIERIVDKEVAKLQRGFRASMASTKTSRTPWTASTRFGAPWSGVRCFRSNGSASSAAPSRHTGGIRPGAIPSQRPAGTGETLEEVLAQSWASNGFRRSPT